MLGVLASDVDAVLLAAVGVVAALSAVNQRPVGAHVVDYIALVDGRLIV